MNEERQRILSMVAHGKLSVEEAEKLLDLIQKNGGAKMVAESPVAFEKQELKYLRVVVDSKQGDNINIRVPMALLKAGLKLSALVPPIAYQKINEQMQQKGVEFDVNQILKSGNIEELIESIGELNVDVNSAQGDKVRVFFE
ncbi:MAG TPA: hypothetical protein VHP36_08235 [Chitinispirillaceae bacterium]|nr:hypothetical protein [Chitinispirillaceae bacterium]